MLLLFFIFIYFFVGWRERVFTPHIFMFPFVDNSKCVVTRLTTRQRYFLAVRSLLPTEWTYDIMSSTLVCKTKGECRAIRQQSPNKLIMETATGKSCSKHRDGFICERTAYYSVSGTLLYSFDKSSII